MSTIFSISGSEWRRVAWQVCGEPKNHFQRGNKNWYKFCFQIIIESGMNMVLNNTCTVSDEYSARAPDIKSSIN